MSKQWPREMTGYLRKLDLRKTHVQLSEPVTPTPSSDPLMWYKLTQTHTHK